MGLVHQINIGEWVALMHTFLFESSYVIAVATYHKHRRCVVDVVNEAMADG